MTLDNEQQRQLLLELIAKTQFPGAAVEIVFELKQVIERADIVPPNRDQRSKPQS